MVKSGEGALTLSVAGLCELSRVFFGFLVLC